MNSKYAIFLKLCFTYTYRHLYLISSAVKPLYIKGELIYMLVANAKFKLGNMLFF